MAGTIGKEYLGRVNLVEEAQVVDNNPTIVLTRDESTGDVRLTPVSAIVSNLIQSVNFNATTPYRLDFKDASGDVVDFVDITVSNVQGAAADSDVIHKNSTPETKTGSLMLDGGNFATKNETADATISLQTSTVDGIPNIQMSNYADTSGKKGTINRFGGEIGIGKIPDDGAALDVNGVGKFTSKVIVGLGTDTGEKLQVTGQVKFDISELPSETHGVTIYCKSDSATTAALQVFDEITGDVLSHIGKNGLIKSISIIGTDRVNTPKVIIDNTGGATDTGEAFQCIVGEGIFKEGLKVNDAPEDPTDVVRLVDLGIKTTTETSSTVIIKPDIATSYRLNPGVGAVELPTLAGNSGKVLFIINNTGGNVNVNSNSGGNDIWDGGSSVSTTVLSPNVPMRLLHDGTQWIIL